MYSLFGKQSQSLMIVTSICQRVADKFKEKAGAGTFRTIEFVTADAHEINFHVIDIKWDFPNSLGCISVEIHLSGTANLP